MTDDEEMTYGEALWNAYREWWKEEEGETMLPFKQLTSNTQLAWEKMAKVVIDKYEAI